LMRGQQVVRVKVPRRVDEDDDDIRKDHHDKRMDDHLRQ
jgi:hypothetical protein